jgi:hypothetical protein
MQLTPNRPITTPAIPVSAAAKAMTGPSGPFIW